MQSKVTQLADYKAIAIPAELLGGSVSPEEISNQLEALSHANAREEDVDAVQAGDSVACRSESTVERWNRPVLLLYPGRGLCTPELENSCVGARTGDIRTVIVEGAELKLTVTRIVRRTPAPVDDILVQAEHIPGVETVEDYRRWYHDTTLAERKGQAARRAVDFLSREISAQSVYEIDEAERDAWAIDQADRQYDAMVAAGIDPTIPTEGTDFLTEEQAREQLRDEYRGMFPTHLANLALLEGAGLNPEAVCQEGIAKLAADSGMTLEALLEQAGENRANDVAISQRALELLADYVKTLMEG